MESWLGKYRPEKTSEMMIEREHIKKIKTFLGLFYNKTDIEAIPNPNLILSGPNGVGKSLLVDLAIKEAGFERIIPDLTTISVAKKTRKKAGEQAAGPDRSVTTFYSNIRNTRKMTYDGDLFNMKPVLLFDDVSNISNPREKEAIKAIVKLNNKNRQIPIIIITNTQHSKFVGDLRKMVTYIVKTTVQGTKKETRKKLTNEISLRHPSKQIMKNIILKIAKAENLKISQETNTKIVEDDVYDLIIDHSQDDIRRLINILEELKLIYKNQIITKKIMESYVESSKRKDIDPGIYEVSKSLLNSYTSVTDALFLYSVERAAIPLMVHENYPRNIKTQYKNMSELEKIRMIRDISRSLSCSDRVDGIIYSNQCWSLQQVHGFHSCVLPSYRINREPNKLHTMEVYSYTQDYNKTSIRRINNKVIKRAQEHPTLRGASILDFLFMATLLKLLLAKKDYEAFAAIMRPYGLKLKEIESIIKIDKIKVDVTKKTAPTITGKPKTFLMELLGVTE